MSATITQRPYQYSPVNNPVVYKFAVTGGPFTLYRLVIGVYKESDDSLIGTMSKSPDLSGNILADISSILKIVLYRDWGLSTLSEDQIGSIGFYIKYQEFYTGSATSPDDDVAEPRTAIIASLQIASNADMSGYLMGAGSSQKFLTKFSELSLWRGYKFSVSMINAQTSYSSRVREYDSQGNLINEYGNVIASGGLVRVFINTVEALTKLILFDIVEAARRVNNSATWSEPSPISADDTFDSKASNNFIKNGMTIGTQYSAEQTTVIPSGETPLNLTTTITVGSLFVGDVVHVWFYYLDVGHNDVGSIHKQYTQSGTRVETLEFPQLSGEARYLAIVSYVTGAVGNTDVTINLPINQPLTFTGASVKSETKTINVKDPCENPIYLFWKNSLGGDSFWLFDGSQDLSWQTDERKAKQLLIFAENITENEFDAISEVNTPGIVYKKNIQELTTSVDRTSEKTDQQLFVIETDGSKIGVINLNRNPGTRTRQVKHIIDVAIEYPELFL